MEKMRKSFAISVETYSGKLGHKVLALELEIGRMRQRVKALRNEADGFEEEADIRQRQLVLRKWKHVNIGEQASSTVRALQERKAEVRDVNSAVNKVLSGVRRK